MFSQRKITHEVNLYLEKQEIERVDTRKFVGVHFESSLSWKIHITNLISRCFPRLNILRAITGSSWGGQQQNPITIL